MALHGNLRTYPRINLESLCTEVADEEEQLSLVVDISERGLRLQRPLRGRLENPVVQLEFELPEADEMVWAKGLICFDQLWRVPAQKGHAGPARIVRTSGVRVVAAASRHLRMLRDYVRSTAEAGRRAASGRRGREPVADWRAWAV
jgi:hypothetical protein